jgi:hypothetical protein
MDDSINREPVSKKRRFDVFKRDMFCCQYCGRMPPAVVLEIDHILPVASGGKSSIDNLITACFDCNRGKGSVPLSSVPQSVAEQAALLAEKLEQVKALGRLVKANRKQKERAVDEVQEVFQVYFEGYFFSPKFRQSVLSFLEQIPAHRLVEFMHVACIRIGRRDDSLKYFCGICWKTIKESR